MSFFLKLKNEYRWTTIMIIVIFCSSIFSINFIEKNVKPILDIQENYGDVNAFNFFTADDNVDIDIKNNKAMFSWDKIENGYFYISSFDNSLSKPPTEKYLDICKIPEESKYIQIDANIGGKYNPEVLKNFDVAMILQLYSTDGQTVSKKQVLNLNSKLERGRIYSIRKKVSGSDKFYKILFRVSSKDSNSSGYFYVNNLDVIFK